MNFPMIRISSFVWSRWDFIVCSRLEYKISPEVHILVAWLSQIGQCWGGETLWEGHLDLSFRRVTIAREIVCIIYAMLESHDSFKISGMRLWYGTLEKNQGIISWSHNGSGCWGTNHTVVHHVPWAWYGLPKLQVTTAGLGNCQLSQLLLSSVPWLPPCHGWQSCMLSDQYPVATQLASHFFLWLYLSTIHFWHFKQKLLWRTFWRPFKGYSNIKEFS